MSLEWNYDKLPDAEVAKVRQWVEVNNELELIKVHNLYKLSRRTYCCTGTGIIEHFKALLDDRSRKEKPNNPEND